MNQIKFLSAALLITLLGTAVSCGSADSTEQNGNVTAAPTTESAAVTEETYPYETKDLGGFALRILNMDDIWDMSLQVDAGETDGEVLNDAIYERSREAESALNFTIEESRPLTDMAEHNKLIQNTVLAGDDVYDVTYASINTTPALITEGYFRNLLDIDGLHLTAEWWDSVVAENAVIDDCLYFATSPMSLMPYDSAWILFFNETMMAAYDMELPYDLVREGKWTMDALHSYTKTIANLNGDANFNYKKDGTCIWGMSCHPYYPDHQLIAAGEKIVEAASDGSLVFGAEDERFFSVISKMAQVLNQSDGSAISASTEDVSEDAGGYIYIFSAGRALFMTGEIKAAQQLRDMDETFGCVPIPKYDESQESYYGDFVSQCLYYTIPVTNSHIEETALASDYLSYLSMRDVLPVYYGNVVEQKGLRNEDSIEMLDIVLSSKTVDLSTLFGWNNILVPTLRSKVFSGRDDVASTVEKQKKKIIASIDDTLAAIQMTKENS